MTDPEGRAPVSPEQPAWQAPQQPAPRPAPPPQDWRTMHPPAAQLAPPQPYVRPSKPPKPPRTWLGPWGGLWITLGAVAIIGLEFLVAWLLRDVQRPSPRDYEVLDPILLLIGSGCVIAGFLYTLAYRVPARWGLSIGRLIGGGLLAGFLAAVAAGMLNGTINAFAGGTDASPSITSLAVVGFVEETCKLAAALVLGRSLPVKNGRVGLFVGAAVGFGFAFVENLGYLETAWSVGLAHNGALVGTLSTAISRQLLGPFLHPVLTGLATAAWFAVARNGRYRFAIGAVGAWAASAVAHSLFDLGASAADNADDVNVGAGITVLAIFGYVIAAFLAWLFVSRALKRRDLAREAEPNS
ncbi:PrsW family intramembrane metalloprotease [Gryllotalpicola protaetiae]|uniref:PrsW family intramembrane metalloprotease n=1 Tax=Gryllotalpicola protaetiae TaxID=2419771 RepID=A0A387BRP7_9MICO|nr:PrsW family glutamic-type intramembrane protease [Gryllotalpicola protaetiae]AYG03656.1 PrsW family intramembrane metalloprotease [Gryllotalpicola protaetiae]